MTSIKKLCSPVTTAWITHNLVRKLSHFAATYDIAIIGGGIIGASTARELKKRHCELRIALVEKEKTFASHQSGNNSGVVHAGIYYRPGSLRAKLCVEGMKLAYDYFDKKKVKYEKCGKLIIATSTPELPRLKKLYERGVANGVRDMKILDVRQMREIQPDCEGLQALWCPNTGIVDYGEVTRSYILDFEQRGGTTFLEFEVKQFIEAECAEYPVIITDCQHNTIKAKYVLTCCGLHSDTVAALTGCSIIPKIVPFRGEYLMLAPNRSHLIKTNIYPVPDPRFPFLGVHITPRIDGRVIIGPNAVLAFSKEGYRWTDFNAKEMKEIVVFSGFRALASQYASFGLKEMVRSVVTPLQLKKIRKFYPILTMKDIEKGPAGVRAQAMDKAGALIEDFVFDMTPTSRGIGCRVLHCRNAPSPGATSALASAILIVDKLEKQFKL